MPKAGKEKTISKTTNGRIDSIETFGRDIGEWCKKIKFEFDFLEKLLEKYGYDSYPIYNDLEDARSQMMKFRAKLLKFARKETFSS